MTHTSVDEGGVKITTPAEINETVGVRSLTCTVSCVVHISVAQGRNGKVRLRR